jgi:hypothetical protein
MHNQVIIVLPSKPPCNAGEEGMIGKILSNKKQIDYSI